MVCSCIQNEGQFSFDSIALRPSFKSTQQFAGKIEQIDSGVTYATGGLSQYVPDAVLNPICRHERNEPGTHEGGPPVPIWEQDFGNGCIGTRAGQPYPHGTTGGASSSGQHRIPRVFLHLSRRLIRQSTERCCHTIRDVSPFVQDLAAKRLTN
uniref:Uncharacterized protein n=1 Tax=Trichuris muris TaxID=70415 RepID=A0A5S6QLC4_TRIMR